MRVTFFLNEAVRNIALTLHWSPKSPARAGPGPRAPPPPPRGPRESWSCGRGVVGQEQAAGAIFVVGKAVLTLYPPLRPLSHNVNPRDGAQDMSGILMANALVLVPLLTSLSVNPQVKCLSSA